MTLADRVPRKPVYRCADHLDGRPGFRIAGEWGHVFVLEGGGHICELICLKHKGINPLRKPQWKTIEPDQYGESQHRRSYGPMPDGRLLAGIAGWHTSPKVSR